MEHNENLGEVLFVNETTLTEKALREFYRKTMKRRWFFIILMALLFLYELFRVIETVVVYAAYNFQLTFGVIGFRVLLTILPLCVFLLYLVLPRISAKKQYPILSRLTGADTPIYTYHFGDQILCSTAAGQGIYEYSQVSRILDSSCGCFLILERSSSCFISADGFSQGSYAEFRQFLAEKCLNLGKKGKYIVKPTTSTPQTLVSEVPEDLGQILFVNETVLTEAIYLEFYKKTLKLWLPCSIFLTVAAWYLLSSIIKIFALGFSPNTADTWWSLGFSLTLTALIIFIAVKYWRLPWNYTKKVMKRHQDYFGEEDTRLRCSIGDRFFVQAANSYRTYDYREITKIIDMDFGCAIVFAKHTAYIIRADGFIQGSYNDFRQFLAAKCPHLNKKRKP